MRIDQPTFAPGGLNTVATASLAITTTTASFATTASFTSMGDWILVNNITIGATTTAPTKPNTRVADFMRYRKVNSTDWEIEMVYVQNSNTGANDGTGVYLYSLPAGLQFNSTFNPTDTATTYGTIASVRSHIDGSNGFITNGVTVGPLYAKAYDSTRFVIIGSNSFGGNLQLNTPLGQGNFALFTNTNFALSMRFIFTAA